MLVDDRRGFGRVEAMRREVVEERDQQHLADGAERLRGLRDGEARAGDDDDDVAPDVERLAELEPVFREDGLITAGNACPMNDGAAALVVMSDTKAKELGLTPLARIVSTGVSALSPEVMGLGPVEAMLR